MTPRLPHLRTGASGWGHQHPLDAQRILSETPRRAPRISRQLLAVAASFARPPRQTELSLRCLPVERPRGDPNTFHKNNTPQATKIGCSRRRRLLGRPGVEGGSKVLLLAPHMVAQGISNPSCRHLTSGYETRFLSLGGVLREP